MKSITHPKYTKANLEEVICTQLDNLHAMQDLLRIMKTQNELLRSINIELRKEIFEVREKQVTYTRKQRK